MIYIVRVSNSKWLSGFHKKMDSMKHKLFFTALIIALVMSCGPNNAEQSGQTGSKVAYAISFIKNVAANVDKDENVVVSPYSAGVALSMLSEGTAGVTKEELRCALNDCLFKSEELAGNDSVIVNSANSVWMHDNFKFKDAYMSVLQQDYNAVANSVNFSDPQTVKQINSWCAEHTDDKITDIIDRLGPGVVMILANALYFNAPWQDSFDEALTSKSVFNGSIKQSEVDMMYRKAVMNYAEFMGCQLVQLSYKGERYSMYVLLPPVGMDLLQTFEYLNEGAYRSALESLTPKEVLLRMPKAKLETSIILNETLKDMGVKSAFTSDADFSGMADGGNLVLDQVKQKCFVEISEHGTEAAAVTVAQVKLTSARVPDFKTMTVNRPYIFFIADSQNIMFVGKVMNL